MTLCVGSFRFGQPNRKLVFQVFFKLPDAVDFVDRIFRSDGKPCTEKLVGHLLIDEFASAGRWALISMTLINDIPSVPKAVGPYSQAVKSGGFLFCSGQIPIDPELGNIQAQDVEGQAKQVLKNIRTLLEAQGLNLSNVVKSTVFLTNMADFPRVNAIYQEAFGPHKPARSTVAVSGLPLGALVEIEVLAQCL